MECNRPGMPACPVAVPQFYGAFIVLNLIFLFSTFLLSPLSFDYAFFWSFNAAARKGTDSPRSPAAASRWVPAPCLRPYRHYKQFRSTVSIAKEGMPPSLRDIPSLPNGFRVLPAGVYSQRTVTTLRSV